MPFKVSWQKVLLFKRVAHVCFLIPWAIFRLTHTARWDKATDNQQMYFWWTSVGNSLVPILFLGSGFVRKDLYSEAVYSSRLCVYKDISVMPVGCLHLEHWTDPTGDTTSEQSVVMLGQLLKWLVRWPTPKGLGQEDTWRRVGRGSVLSLGPWGVDLRIGGLVCIHVWVTCMHTTCLRCTLRAHLVVSIAGTSPTGVWDGPSKNCDTHRSAIIVVRKKRVSFPPFFFSGINYCSISFLAASLTEQVKYAEGGCNFWIVSQVWPPTALEMVYQIKGEGACNNELAFCSVKRFSHAVVSNWYHLTSIRRCNGVGIGQAGVRGAARTWRDWSWFTRPGGLCWQVMRVNWFAPRALPACP